MKALCKKYYSQSKCRDSGYNHKLRKIFIIKIIEGEMYDVDFNYIPSYFNTNNRISIDVKLKDGFSLNMSTREGTEYFYSHEETKNILRTELIDKILS